MNRPLSPARASLPANPLANPLAKLSLGLFLVLVLLLAGYRFGGGGVRLGGGAGTFTVSDAEECLRRGGNIYFNVTFGSEDYLRKIGEWETARRRSRLGQPFVISANTHVGSVRDLSLEDKIFLVFEGRQYPMSGKPVVSATHHNTYLVFFPRFDMAGQPVFDRTSGTFDILIKGVEFPERRLTFRLPMPSAGRPGLDLPRLAMLFGSALAALLVACTPCLVGSLAVGSFTMGAAAGAAGERDAMAKVRAAMVRRTLFHLAALIVTYLVVAQLTAAFKATTAYLRPAEVAGGLVLLAIGLGFLRAWGPAAVVEGGVRRALARFLPGAARGGRETEAPVKPGNGASRRPDDPLGLDAGASSAVGASLAMVCSVAGAPTLSTAIILPVMVYAGVNDFYGSLLILAVYLMVSAVPFFLIAVGLGEALLTASVRWRRRLLVANGLLLVFLGLLLVFSQQRVADVLSAPARSLLAPFVWLLGRLGGSPPTLST